MAKFVIKKSKDSQFYWTFVADNGQVIATTETYTAKESAAHAVAVVKDKAAAAAIEDTTKS